jgi:hypothetical protein
MTSQVQLQYFYLLLSLQMINIRYSICAHNLIYGMII